MNECVFCNIINDKSRKFEFESANFVVFETIEPKAPIHLLITTRGHVVDARELDGSLWPELVTLAKNISDALKLDGFRMVVNVGTSAQVKHFHMHFLGNVRLDRAV